MLYKNSLYDFVNHQTSIIFAPTLRSTFAKATADKVGLITEVLDYFYLKHIAGWSSW